MANECPKCQTNIPNTVKFCGECGTPLEADVIHTKSLETPAVELKRGSIISGRYEIIEELGKGGMGKVYRVEDTKTKEELALKLINPRDQQIAYELGGTNVSLGRYEQAEIWFNRCLEIYPQHLPALLGKVGIFVLDEGDTQKARALLETLPSHQLTDYMWVTIRMLERNYTDVLDRINALTYDSYEDQHFYFQKNLSLAGIHFVLSETSQMRGNAQAARLVLEPIVQARPDDPRFHTALGLVYAYLGERDDALREGNQAASLHPPSRDAGQGPIYVLNMARIYTVLGEAEKAIEQLEFMLSNPHAEFLWHLVSRHQLRLDPQWDSLRDNPRFQALLSED